MLNLLNALTPEQSTFWLIVALGILLILEIAVLAILFIRSRRKKAEPEVEERKPISITLDTSIVKREYVLGEAFEASGLIVTVHYNDEPYEETLDEITVVTPALIEEFLHDGKKLEEFDGCLVYPPDLSNLGKPTVDVRYQGLEAAYAVSVVPATQIEAQVEEVVLEEVAASEEPKRVLLNVTLDTESVQKEFACCEQFNADNLVVIAHYNLEPLTETVESFVCVTKEMLENLAVLGSAINTFENCSVFVPSMTEGENTVIVKYCGMESAYAINVVAAAEEAKEEPETVEVVENVEAVEATCEPKRVLLNVTLDTTNVKSEFALGEKFTAQGLVVTAIYSDEPTAQTVNHFVCVTEEALTVLAGLGKSINTFEDCYVFVPSMKEGENTVIVKYCGMESAYAINVVVPVAGGMLANVLEEPIELLADVIEENVEPEHLLLNIALNTDNVQKEFTVGDEFTAEGLVVTLCYNVEPLTETVDSFVCVTKETLASMQELGNAVNTFENCVVFVPEMTEGEQTVVVKYLGMESAYAINVVAPAPVEETEEAEETEDESFENDEDDDFVLYKESSKEAGVLRYDRSFTARLIQSDDELKSWYTELKNELLSYKKIHDRMSWKRESYRFGRIAAARLVIRGKTLCLYLPLNPADYEETKYKVELVQDSVTYEDTPCLYRIKNSRRVKYAKDLIATVMANLGAKRVERESVDYYLPYEGLVELINKKLIKRVVKSKKDEAFFNKASEQETSEEVNKEPIEVAPGILVVTEKLDEVKEEQTTETVTEEIAVTEEVVEELAAEEPATEEVVEEPVAEEPATEEVVEEPVAEEPITEEVVEEPATEEPATEEVVEEPVAEEPATEEVVEEPAAEEPATEEVVEEPAAEESATEEVVEEPVAEEPATEEVVEEPAAEEPATEETQERDEAANEPSDDKTPSYVTKGRSGGSKLRKNRNKRLK